MGLYPHSRGHSRAGYGFATPGTADFRLDSVVAAPAPYEERRITRWDRDDARQSLRDQVLTHLASPYAVLVLDESAFVKANGRFVGAHRGTDGGGVSHHLQTGVFLAYAGPKGNGYLDRELFLPRPWIERSDLRLSSGVPDGIAYSTRPQMARRMLERAFEHQIPHRFVAGSITFGADRDLRAWLEERREAYVLAVPADMALLVDGAYRSAEELAASLSHHTRASEGPEGWMGMRLPSGGGSRTGMQAGGRGDWQRWIVAECKPRGAEPSDRFLAFVRPGTLLDDVVDAIKASRRIRDGMSEARRTVGLDRFTGKSWEAWYRHMTVTLMAHTVLGLAREQLAAGSDPLRSRFDGDGYD
ncbi:MAG: transposase [Chthonomonadales bacterium]|nr:transposase [Chthonomonadales bacterium]